MIIIMMIIMNKICKAKKRPELKALGRLKMKTNEVDMNLSWYELEQMDKNG